MTRLTAAEHSRAADAATKAAESLGQAQSAWHVVALHYSALHRLHADLANRSDLDDARRHPETHKSRWGSDGQRTAWGINDVVRAVYDKQISGAYLSLVQGSHAVRYCAPFRIDGNRFWTDHETIRRALNNVDD